MASTTEHPQPPDICLLLRAFAEQRWLTSELMPHLSDLERSHAIPEDQLGAALAYLEVLWLDAQSRAAETDAAFASLQPHISERCHVLHARARRYYAAVQRLRRELDSRVRRITQPHVVSDLRCARIQLRD